jgi:aminodeoxychorismate lyase
MIVYLNGRFVPAEQATVSVFDRGFLYGDGLFESVRVYAGQPFLWQAHTQRLIQGAAALRIALPTDMETLRSSLTELLDRNQLANAVVRISLSRGSGPRGYSIRGADQPTLVMAAHPAASLTELPALGWTLHTARHRLPAHDPVAAFKTANKLTHILARTEAEAAGADEALLLNTDGHVAETSAANVFWLAGRTAFTPDLNAGCLAGVTRGFVLSLLQNQGWETREVLAGPEALLNSEGAFMTVSTLGIVAITHLDRQPIAQHPRLGDLRESYRKAIGHPPSSDGICH